MVGPWPPQKGLGLERAFCVPCLDLLPRGVPFKLKQVRHAHRVTCQGVQDTRYDFQRPKV